MHPDALAARLACILLGYLFGSFLTAEVVARVVSGKSARQLGTGNPGMANIATHLGKKGCCLRCSVLCYGTTDRAGVDFICRAWRSAGP